MTYRLQDPRTLAEDVTRIIGSQVAKASDAIDDPDDLGVAETVHEVRRRCKKLRAVARLVRTSIGDEYAPVNQAFRDAGRLLSAPRDAEASTEILDDLIDSAPEGLELPDLAPLRAALETAASLAVEEVVEEDRLVGARALIEDGRRRAERWDFDADGFDVLAGGIAKSYRRARKRFRTCADGADTESLHEWRKRVKYHRYHLRLLQRTAPVLTDAWERQLHDLTDLLGDDHDLSVLVRTIRVAPDAFGGDRLVDAVALLAQGRRADLQRRALSLGARLFGEPTDVVVDRLRSWWEAWETEGPSPEHTELAAL